MFTFMSFILIKLTQNMIRTSFYRKSGQKSSFSNSVPDVASSFKNIQPNPTLCNMGMIVNCELTNQGIGTNSGAGYSEFVLSAV